MPHERPFSNVKISFIWSLHYLKNNCTFEEAIRDMITRGGDTTANAAVVGALLGALHGIEGIDPKFYEPVLAYRAA